MDISRWKNEYFDDLTSIKKKALDLLIKGMSVKDVADNLDIPLKKVSKWKNEYFGK
nr:helix-turn-helix domain-containing protein [Neobacillus sp. Marseille-Q6967]